MTSLLFNCPKTNRSLPTGIETDAKSLEKSWWEILKLMCPFCGESHRVSVSETYINSILNDVSRPRLASQHKFGI
jgi:RNase P subunit RPR2